MFATQNITRNVPMNVRLTKDQKVQVTSPNDIFEIMRKILVRENKLRQQKEHFWVIGLAASNKILYIELISLGSISAAIVNPLEVFNLAVQKKSPQIILVHNHPGETLNPSKEDVEITENIVAGGKILQISVLDHLIITTERYYSFREHGKLE